MSTVAVTSFDRATWREDAGDEALRQDMGRTLNHTDPEQNAVILRRLFPLRAKLRKDCKMLGFQKDTVLKYARVRKEPSPFPVQVFFTGQDARGTVVTRTIYYNSSEVEVLDVREG